VTARCLGRDWVRRKNVKPLLGRRCNAIRIVKSIGPRNIKRKSPFIDVASLGFVQHILSP
jgi:hypothetical protein